MERVEAQYTTRVQCSWYMLTSIRKRHGWEVATVVSRLSLMIPLTRNQLPSKHMGIRLSSSSLPPEPEAYLGPFRPIWPCKMGESVFNHRDESGGYECSPQLLYKHISPLQDFLSIQSIQMRCRMSSFGKTSKQREGGATRPTRHPPTLPWLQAPRLRRPLYELGTNHPNKYSSKCFPRHAMASKGWISRAGQY